MLETCVWNDPLSKVSTWRCIILVLKKVLISKEKLIPQYFVVKFNRSVLKIFKRLKSFRVIILEGLKFDHHAKLLSHDRKSCVSNFVLKILETLFCNFHLCAF